MNQQFIWREGRYVDVWSINHLLFGFLSCYALYELLRLGIFVSCLICFVLYVVWELFEKAVSTGEYVTNQMMDVIADAIGFGGFILVRHWVLIPAHFFIVPILIVFVVLESFGYYAKFRFRLKGANVREK